jgi:hypothetical protein
MLKAIGTSRSVDVNGDIRFLWVLRDALCGACTVHIGAAARSSITSVSSFGKSVMTPIGATGAILATRLVHSVRRDRGPAGHVFIGGGQGIALALEMLP